MYIYIYMYIYVFIYTYMYICVLKSLLQELQGSLATGVVVAALLYGVQLSVTLCKVHAHRLQEICWMFPPFI